MRKSSCFQDSPPSVRGRAVSIIHELLHESPLWIAIYRYKSRSTLNYTLTLFHQKMSLNPQDIDGAIVVAVRVSLVLVSHYYNKLLIQAIST